MNTIKSKRIRWYRHIKRMEKGQGIRRITEWRSNEEGLLGISLGVQGYDKQVQDRKKWKTIVETAKTSNTLEISGRKMVKRILIE